VLRILTDAGQETLQNCGEAFSPRAEAMMRRPDDNDGNVRNVNFSFLVGALHKASGSFFFLMQFLRPL
jgi:hypothetical protein